MTDTAPVASVAPSAPVTFDAVEDSVDTPLRRLVTVQRVVDLIPIEGKDRIELAKVLGYFVVVEKGSVRIGNLVAFHEVDSFLPVDAAHGQYAFLAKDAKVVDGDVARFRIRTRKFGEAYSQGLIVPLAKLATVDGLDKAGEGDDLTAALNVIKYEPPTAGAKVSRSHGVKGPPPPNQKPWPGEFLDGISKTDEERLQSAPGILKDMHGLAVAVMVKCDGQSITVAKDLDGKVVVCSRNFELIEVEGVPLDSFNQIARECIISQLPPGYAIQGEVCGPGIQSNRMGLASKHVFVFNVFRRQVEGDTWQELDLKTARGFCADHGIECVPMIQRGWVLDVTGGRHTVSTFVELSKQVYGNDFPAEGIVVRPETPQRRRVGGRLSFKTINPEFELRV